MINNIKESIAHTLCTMYENITIYEDDIPNGFTTPSFVIYTNDIDSSRLINDGYNNVIEFDLCYFSDKDREEIKTDITNVRYELSHLDKVSNGIDTYRLINRQTNIVDDVLHYTYSIRLREQTNNNDAVMNTVSSNINKE